jgi:hypothetical protein
MIRQANLDSPVSPEQVWAEAERVRQHPDSPWAQEFARSVMVSRQIQFSHRPVPANKWFIDWGLPRASYGGYGLVDVVRFGRTSRSKLTSALCPKCRNPIFSLLVRNGHGLGYPIHTRRQCVICGYSENLIIRRDGDTAGDVIHNGLHLHKEFGAKEWAPAP